VVEGKQYNGNNECIVGMVHYNSVYTNTQIQKKQQIKNKVEAE